MGRPVLNTMETLFFSSVPPGKAEKVTLLAPRLPNEFEQICLQVLSAQLGHDSNLFGTDLTACNTVPSSYPQLCKYAGQKSQPQSTAFPRQINHMTEIIIVPANQLQRSVDR